MKNLGSFCVCEKCFDNLIEKGRDALLLYLDVCIQHFDGKPFCMFFEEEGFELVDLNFLEKEGYVISADTAAVDVIKILPRIRKTVDGYEYCCERRKHL